MRAHLSWDREGGKEPASHMRGELFRDREGGRKSASQIRVELFQGREGGTAQTTEAYPPEGQARAWQNCERRPFSRPNSMACQSSAPPSPA
eukprot:285154-Chlamydomonas_euryale.AAC.3